MIQKLSSPSKSFLTKLNISRKYLEVSYQIWVFMKPAANVNYPYIIERGRKTEKEGKTGSLHGNL